MLCKKWERVKGYVQTSGRIILIKIETKSVNIVFIQVYMQYANDVVLMMMILLTRIMASTKWGH